MMTRTESMMIGMVKELSQEINELRRQNTVLLDRLHQCKRRNREDKIKLRKQLSDILGVTVF